jgi:copper chaperone CopZ
MRARPVESFDDDLARLAERMTALMHDANGVGLAATQVGVLQRLFVFSHEGEDRVLVNPVVTRSSRDAELEDEGCLSLRDVLVPVERPTKVTIEGAGLAAFYRDRPVPSLPDALRNGAEDPVAPGYDAAIAARAGWVRARPDGTADIALLLEGITCGACVWLLETWLGQQEGVLAARVNLALRRAEVRVDPARIALARLLAAVAQVGYRAYPYDPARREAAARREGRVLLRRTALALLAMMLVMMLPVCLISGLAGQRIPNWVPRASMSIWLSNNCCRPNREKVSRSSMSWPILFAFCWIRPRYRLPSSSRRGS